jgi:hypothetical protein
MTANPKQLYEKSDVSMLSERDIIILKLILCSGLYPNIAIPDESNYSRPASEQMYHTKTNRHISMNSFSVFTFRPELLQGFETDFNDSMCPERRMTEVVCFMKVLETHKPFIMNPLKIKALPVSLLFAQKLDISSGMIP